MSLKFSLVGCGRIAKRHSELLGLNKIQNAKLHSVCDVNEEQAKSLGDKFGVDYFTDMNQMVLETNPDVVVVLTPSGNHANDVIELSQYKKHLVVEKPMALNLDDADKMINACDQAGVRLFVVKQNRFNLPIVKLKEAIDQGRFGKLVLGTIRVRWCRDQSYYDQASWRGTIAQDGGVLSNQASHHIDMLTWMMGDVDMVFGFGATQLVKIEAEDTAVSSLKFRNGALGIVEATTATRPKDLEGSISILVEKGAVEVGGFAMNEIKNWMFDKETEEDKEIIKNFSVNPPNVYGFGHQAYYEHVVESILNDGPNLIDGFSGRKSIELISAIYESMETGRLINMRSYSRQ